jgi:predicted DNA-binding transcriptional regulator YafY
MSDFCVSVSPAEADRYLDALRADGAEIQGYVGSVAEDGTRYTLRFTYRGLPSTSLRAKDRSAALMELAGNLLWVRANGYQDLLTPPGWEPAP